MGWDTVSFSLKSTYQDNTIYNTWLNRVKNGNTKEFKEYLLSSDENLQLFAKHFDNYQEGDMFVKESVVELADGRLLCFDADQAQAYIIDLENINESRDTICMNVIKPNDPSASYDKQIENIVKQIKAHIGEDKFKTKDGTKLDIDYITNNLLASKSLSLYQEAKGITTDSSSGETTTSIDTRNLNKIYYKDLSQITNEEEEKEYYQTLLESLGVTIDNDNKIVDGANVIQGINEIIGQISKNLNPTTLTLANQNRLNLIEIVRKLSLSEITLIEKLNPGLLSTIGEFIGTYQGVTYTNKYGQRTSTSETITWADLMKEKTDMQDDPLAYLRFEDRPETKSNGTILKISIGGNENTFNISDEIPEYTYKDSNGITYTFDKDGEVIKVGGGKADAANKLATNQVDMAKPAIEVSSYIENTQAQGVSDTTIEAYIDDFKKYFSGTWGKDDLTCTNPDEALMFLAELRNPEVAFRLLQDSDVQKAIKVLSKAKGSLAGGKGQTPEMYYVGADGDVAVDGNGNLLTAPKELTVSNVATHLGILTELYKMSRYDENGQYISGDKERISDERSMSSIESLLSGLTQGENLTYDQGYETGLGVTAAAAGTVGGVAAVGGAITKAVANGKVAYYTKKLKDLGEVSLKNSKISRSKYFKLGENRTQLFKVNNSKEIHLGNKYAKAKYSANSAIKSASSVAKVGGAVAGAAIGGYLGYQVAEGLINSSPERYTNSDGTFAETKANCVKGGLTVGGAIIGGTAGWCVAAGTLTAIGPVGWAVLGVAAVVAVGFGLLSHFTNWFKK